ncbi:unnamed protein product [Nesidiocoris tenuis]|uniref:Lon protease AAA+ ATPase lid domain-containing protein n=1 Tax=Nesidiocoris tenuis TaxID=355587 RepID=A0A6H5GIH2_9HEMI|nr:unnamed protein product [Nesidiocoris tenuis]
MSQLGIAKRLGDPEFSPDRIAEEFEFTYEEKLEILEALSFSVRLTKMISIMEKILQEHNMNLQEEKYHIAKDFIIPKLLKDHGLEAESVMIPEETLRFVVSAYSREAGVRTLERKIAALLRDAALKIAAMTADGSAPLDLLIDIETVKAVLGDALEIIPVDHMAEVIDFAFNGAINEIASLVSKL